MRKSCWKSFDVDGLQIHERYASAGHVLKWTSGRERQAVSTITNTINDINVTQSRYEQRILLNMIEDITGSRYNMSLNGFETWESVFEHAAGQPSEAVPDGQA